MIKSQFSESNPSVLGQDDVLLALRSLICFLGAFRIGIFHVIHIQHFGIHELCRTLLRSMQLVLIADLGIISAEYHEPAYQRNRDYKRDEVFW
jgi:acyl-coenzyme A synthetase/AMP-(fatty) acid ligase